MTNENLKLEPIEIAIAMSLYAYNVSPITRAEKLYEHFRGACADLNVLARIMSQEGYAATTLALPTAELYVQHAVERYGKEARERVRIDRGGFDAALDAYEAIKDEAAEEAANKEDAERQLEQDRYDSEEEEIHEKRVQDHARWDSSPREAGE